MIVKLGDKAPDFNLPDENGNKLRLSSLRGSKILLYFYPKDMTPGCTKEAEGFRDSINIFADHNTKVIGVSKDSVKRHGNFKKKYNLPFSLVSDEHGKVCDVFGVWVKKKNYGRTYMGIERSTFLINEDGKIVRVWRKVRVKGHVEEVLESILI